MTPRPRALLVTLLALALWLLTAAVAWANLVWDRAAQTTRLI